MTAYERRSVGEEASGGALLSIGADSANERHRAAEKPAASLRRH